MAAILPITRVTRTADADDVRQSLPQTLAAVAHDGERIVVEEDGVAVAAIVSPDDLRELKREGCNQGDSQAGHRRSKT